MKGIKTKEVTELTAGKTYVFKDDQAKKDYIHHNNLNTELLQYYNEGFTLDKVEDGEGLKCQHVVIGSDELRFFKLKETPQPENMIDITLYCYLASQNRVEYCTQDAMATMGWKLLSEQTVSVVVPESSETSTIEHNRTINTLLKREERDYKLKREELESKLIPEQ